MSETLSTTLSRLTQADIALARQTTLHALCAICDDPAKFNLLGNFTETYAKLTELHATLWAQDLETVRANFRPDQLAWAQFLARREEEKRLIALGQEHERLARESEEVPDLASLTAEIYVDQLELGGS